MTIGKKLFAQAAAILIAATAILSAMGKPSLAAADVKQTAQTTTSITITWSKPNLSSGDTLNGYSVYFFDSNKQQAKDVTPISLPASQLTYTFNGLTAGTKYSVKIDYNFTNRYGRSNTTLLASSYGGLRTLPGTVQNVHQLSWYVFAKEVNFQWDGQTGVDGYEYRVKNSGKKTVAKKDNGRSTRSCISIKNNMVYSLYVRAYTTINGTKYYSEWTKPCYMFTQPWIRKTSLNKKKKTLYVKWDKVKGATRYKIYVSTTQQGKYTLAKTVKANVGSATLKKYGKNKFKPGKNYFVYLVAEKTVNGRTYDSGRNYVFNSKKQNFGYLNKKSA